MVAPRHRSRSMRRVRITTPGGRRITHYRPRKHNRAQCGSCGEPLQAVMTARPSVLRSFAKTERKPTRPYGGVLCSRCTRALIKSKARSL